MLPADLRTFLIDQVELSALIASRVYHLTGPQPPVFPYVRFQTISLTPEIVMEGEGNLLRSIWQIDVFTDAAADASGTTMAALNLALEDALIDFAGTMGTTTVRDVRRLNKFDDYEPPVPGRERPIKATKHEFEIWHEQA